GHRPAAEYGQLAAETARAMRRAHPDLELVACGSSHSSMPTFPAWEQAVLEAGYEAFDMVSAHVYYREEKGDQASYLASADDMDAYIEDVAATCDHVRALGGHDKRIMISFDEWNVTSNGHGDPGTEPSGEDWPVAPRFAESTYTAQDAVVVGSLLISLLRHTDRVASASQAQLVNVLGPIRTSPDGPAWRQTIFHPFALTSRHAAGQVLRTQVDSPTYENPRFGRSKVLDSVVTWDEEAGRLVVFAVSRSRTEPLALTVPLAGFGPLEVTEAVMLHEDDPYTVNTAEDPDRVVPRPLEGAHLAADDARPDGPATLTAALPPISCAVIRLHTASCVRRSRRARGTARPRGSPTPSAVRRHRPVPARGPPGPLRRGQRPSAGLRGLLRRALRLRQHLGIHRRRRHLRADQHRARRGHGDRRRIVLRHLVRAAARGGGPAGGDPAVEGLGRPGGGRGPSDVDPGLVEHGCGPQLGAHRDHGGRRERGRPLGAGVRRRRRR